MLDSEDLDKKLEKEQDIYQRVKLLGSGAFGKAYLVQQKRTKEFYVVKQIDISDLSPQEQENVKKQAKILEALNHPNVVRFKEVYGTSKLKLNIVMEYADGGDLAAKIEQAKNKNEYFEQIQILNWFTQMCLAIKHIHDRKIIHRDLKGQNIFLSQDDTVKIGDFGVARVLEHTIAKAKTVVGSPYYLSPEIIENRPYSFKTDIWSLGVLLYEMCSLIPPFTANNIQFLALKIVKGSFSNIPSQYSNDLRQLIRSMLNTNPNQRPTINQILSSPIINQRIKTFLTESKIKNEFSHTVLHKFNPFTREPENKLRPPPNLLEIESNGSQTSYPTYTDPWKNNGAEPKSKTPYANIKKGATNSRPPVGGKKQNAPGVNQQQNLDGLMQIKPSLLEPAIKLPKVPSNHMEKVRVETPNIIVRNNSEKPPRKNFTSNAFNKKKSVEDRQADPNAVNRGKTDDEIGDRQKITAESPEAKPNSRQESRKVTLRVPRADKKPIAKKCESKKHITISAKKGSKAKEQSGKAVRQQKKQKPIELVSEQVRKKQEAQKATKKLCKKKGKVNPKQPIEKTEKHKDQQQAQKFGEGEAFEEEKCNSSQNYEEEVSDAYEKSEGSQAPDHVDDEGEVSLSLSKSAVPQGSQLRQNGNNYSKMLAEMELISNMVEKAKGMVDDLPLIGEEIPDFDQALNELREDDTDLEGFEPTLSKRDSLKTVKETNLNCLADQGELQNLRIALEQVFGLQNLLPIYKQIEQIMSTKGLEFNEEETITMLLRAHPLVQQSSLRKHFRLVVTVIALDRRLQEVN